MFYPWRCESSHRRPEVIAHQASQHQATKAPTPTSAALDTVRNDLYSQNCEPGAYLAACDLVLGYGFPTRKMM
jgi:hypothetical protein